MIDSPSIWAVGMVRDELDILPYTLAHLDRQGLTGIIVADNMSTDGTWEYLHDAGLSTPLIFQRDTEVGYYQSRKMTVLARQAFAEGATWVIPFDADEVWRVVTREPPRPGYVETLADVLLRERWLRHVDCLQFPLYYYYPCAADDDDEPNPFLRIEHRSRDPQQLPKVMVRNRPDLVILQGNHGAYSTEDKPVLNQLADSFEIAHYPFRGYANFEHKIVNGCAAYRATDLSRDVGGYWREYGELLEEHGPDALRGWYEQWFVEPDIPLEYHPIARGFDVRFALDPTERTKRLDRVITTQLPEPVT